MSKRMAEKAGKSERKVKDRFFKTQVPDVIIPCFFGGVKSLPTSKAGNLVLSLLSVSLRRKRRNSRQLTASQAGSASFATSTLSHFRLCWRLRQPFSPTVAFTRLLSPRHYHSDAPLDPRLTHLPLVSHPSSTTESLFFSVSHVVDVLRTLLLSRLRELNEHTVYTQQEGLENREAECS